MNDFTNQEGPATFSFLREKPGMNQTIEPLLLPHGGYRKLKGFQIAQLVYDMTVRFTERYIEKSSRTRDQMVQAARSGVQNIAEGSEASATSKKMELKLTQVARASLEELKLDYEDFLRHRKLPKLEPKHPALMRFKALKPQTLEEVQAWVAQEKAKNTDGHGRTQTKTPPETGSSSVPVRVSSCHSVSSLSVPVRVGPCQSVPSPSVSSACLAANAALSLLNLACYLLDRQVGRLARDFEAEGGFTERLYRIRGARRGQQ
jgi:four helix bundle suffix protein